ncbi:DUF6229 family protein [Dyella acidiphila]|uniref:Uncharacterized protein n=1 Tax=Dyella acidiphila TaxID=2775866 RepID=A0ABR9GCR7_9GAMM|nr:DUF6229 family protein [Dyella acidiphila]MBE1161784.1 hypothetical protein [Dyella acidiphila]
MQQNDEVVSGWLNGDDCVAGYDNPAGSLYVDNATEQKMTAQAGAEMIDTMLKTTQSCASGCACC